MARTSPQRRLQNRVSIDPEMGSIYEHLVALDPKIRAREIVYLLRLGAEVHLSARALRLDAEVARAPRTPAPQTQTVEASATSPSLNRNPDESTALRMATWDLNAMCTPPPRSANC